MKTPDLTGNKYGRWTVIEKGESKQKGETMWLCRCECGIEKYVRHSSLTTGNSKSCGCYHSERTSQAHLKHGHYGERLYGVWNGMRQRCGNPNNHKYSEYGGRGIAVCDEWADYGAFRSWAYENGYDPNVGLQTWDQSTARSSLIMGWFPCAAAVLGSPNAQGSLHSTSTCL